MIKRASVDIGVDATYNQARGKFRFWRQVAQDGLDRLSDEIAPSEEMSTDLNQGEAQSRGCDITIDICQFSIFH